LAKEPSIKVEVKSLPQPACLGCKVTVAEYEPVVLLTISMALEHMLPMLLECHRGVAFCRDRTFGCVDTGHMVPAVNAFASDTTGIVGVIVAYCRFLQQSASGASQPTGPETPPLINDLSRGSVDTREDLVLLSSDMQNAVIVLVGIQARLYSLIRENEHVYAWDVTSSSIRHSIFNRYESVACQVAMR
jgi:hypothetical protein